MVEWRLYIDESGDHTYKHLGDLDKRYLGVTGILFLKRRYDSEAQPQLEALKRRIFRYDPDDPPILTRSQIRSHKRWFYLLQDLDLSNRWEEELLAFLTDIHPYAQVFTVVMDKKQHLEDYPFQTFDPYVYCLSVLLNRVRGYMGVHGGRADVLAEARGTVEDHQIELAYESLRNRGSRYGTAQGYSNAFPSETLLIRRKDQNIAGLQIADVVAYGQKILTVQENKKPFDRPLSGFTQRINQAIGPIVNRYGRYLLQ